MLLLAKHGNRASSSLSGAADLLQAISPHSPAIAAVNASNLPTLYQKSNYAFLFAPNFHPGMKYVASLRKEKGIPTIFNLLGPLTNPVNDVIEARIIGVRSKSLGSIFQAALHKSGVKKAMVVCGAEDLDEISCAGKTYCWRITEEKNPAFKGPKDEEDEEYTTSDDEAPPRTLAKLESFTLEPADFGLPAHPLAEVGGGKLPHENAEILMRMLSNNGSPDDPVLHFVLMNTAALLVVSGICDAESSAMGEGDDGKVLTERGPGGGRWKEGVRRARYLIESGAALRSLETFIEATNAL